MRIFCLLVGLTTTASADVAVDDLGSSNERRLARAWRGAHPTDDLPTCDRQRDPVAVLHADVDPTPGRELILANNRFGVAMFAANGALLATSVDTPGCRRWPDSVSGDTSAKLSTLQIKARSYPQLALRTRNVGHCGEFKTTDLYERRGRTLEEILEIDEKGSQGCNIWESEVRATVRVVGPGQVTVHYRGKGASTSNGKRTSYEVDQIEHASLAADGKFHTDDGHTVRLTSRRLPSSDADP